MSEKEREPAERPDSAEDQAETVQPEEGAPEEESPTGDDERIKELESQVGVLKEQYEELEGRYRRLLADFDNFRRRSRREFAEVGDRAKAELTRELLPILDNLQRALEVSEKGSESVIEGVRMVLRQFQEVLEKAGLRPIPSVGLPFDPNFHEAVQRVEDPEAPEGTVVQELRPGYTFKGQLLRPSMVLVSSGNSGNNGGDQEDEQSNRD